MSSNKIQTSVESNLIAHTLVLGGIISVLPKQKAEEAKAFALLTLDKKLSIEKSKAIQNNLMIETLESATSIILNFFPKD